MQSAKLVVPLAVAIGLVAAAPAVAKSDSAGKHQTRHSARAAGGDVPPTLPSIVRVRINRGEKALAKAGDLIDRDQTDKAILALRGARRNMYAAWRGAVYVINTAPPPVADDASVHRGSAKAHKSGGAVTGTVYADPVTTAVAVLGFQHDVASAAYGMADGAKGTLLSAVNTTIFAALDRRDSAISFISKLPPAADAAEDAVTFDLLMPGVAGDVQDEVQQVQGSLANDAVDPTGKKILKDAEVQALLTENTINTIWPPAPVDA